VAQNGDRFGLPAATIPSLATAGACPAGQGKYCWSLNWNVFPMSGMLGQGLAIYPDAFQPGNTTYYIPLELGEVVDFAFINPSAMVHPM
jgi:hypothetical protein